jgi:CRP-like cAMP-binding protein
MTVQAKKQSANSGRRESALAHQIADLAFFRGMHKAHLSKLAECATRVEFAPGEKIFQAGDPANRFYVVETGSVQVETPALGMTPIPIQSVGSGDVLGWSWLYPPYEWNLNAWATEPCEAIFFFAAPMSAELDADPIFGNAMYQRIAQVMMGRLHHMRTQLVAAHRNTPS